MEELEGCMAVMEWDWDADNIDVNEDNREQGVPMTP